MSDRAMGLDAKVVVGYEQLDEPEKEAFRDRFQQLTKQQLAGEQTMPENVRSMFMQLPPATRYKFATVAEALADGVVTHAEVDGIPLDEQLKLVRSRQT